VPELRLEAREFRDLTRWRWVLTDAAGRFLAGHEVRLDPAAWEFEAFADLRGYVLWHAEPGRYRDDEARIVAGVGAWAGAHVLGRPVSDALAEAAGRGPVTVRVVVGPEARELLFRPLELTHVHGRPLARQDVTLVLQAGSAAAPSRAGDRLRVLGLFSLPEGGQPLNLRRERHELVRLIQRMATSGKAADVRVLQYGVTRSRLRDVLDEAEGWDVIHVSGHGAPGELLLETASGAPDRVSVAELADMLGLARGRAKLITLSACWSAADATAEQRRLLGLPVLQDRDRNRFAGRPMTPRSPPGALATSLSERLGCAVLAMRFPVADDFAIALSGELYRLLAEKGEPLPRAVAMALRELRHGEYPALSVAAPALFGETAIGLTLAAPPQRSGEDGHDTPPKMTGFPPQPARFVGRTRVMARASATLAAESGRPGVLLHGMPGGGKSACALELSYTHAHAFDRLVWFKVPDEGMAIDGALTDFALTLERDLPGLQMVHLVASADKLTAFLPRLTELMRQRRLLIVIDNAESLLTDDGAWCDDRWGQVVGALTAHRGPGRVILTSRRVAQTPDALVLEAVDALSASEGLLLARELPHLRALVFGRLPGLGPDPARKLALGVLNVAQGHPKLLELADSQAADPDRLAALVAAGEEEWREQGGIPEGFFAAGESSALPEDYLRVLATWTRAVADTLTPGERDLFWLLCCLEEPDRALFVLEGNWAGLWHRLGRDGEPPDLDRVVDAVTARGLAAVSELTWYCTVHPGVAAAGRARAAKIFQDAVDAEVSAFWAGVCRHASGARGGNVNTELMVRAGLAAAPYLIRRQEWAGAMTLLELAFSGYPSRQCAAAVLPAIEQIVRHEPEKIGVLARVLQVTDPVAAESRLRAALGDAVHRADHRAATAITGFLVNQCMVTGRLAEALAFADEGDGYARQAGLGPWSLLGNKARRLQVLNAMGQASQVLAEVLRLRDQMRNLPAVPGPDEITPPWDVREALLDTGRAAAHQVSRWKEALDFNAEVAASRTDRHVPAAEIARARSADASPLRHLGRTDEALRLLQECLQAFQAARDIQAIGKTLAELADIEDDRSHGDAAVRLQRDAFRYSYLAGDVTGITVGYHNLGNYHYRHTHQAAEALACHLAADLICTLSGTLWAQRVAHAPAADLAVFGAAAVPPADVADLCARVGDIPGTDLAGLIARLAPDAETAERTLRDLVTQAAKMASQTMKSSRNRRAAARLRRRAGD
jgi:tetratricopeptide (TPR) repeat protein